MWGKSVRGHRSRGTLYSPSPLVGIGGSVTQGDLLMLAANLDLNAQQINLVGLQQSGVEFV